MSKKNIEDHENDQFLKKISSLSKNKIEDKLIYELVKNYSSKDLAKALVSLNKLQMAPIEDIENIQQQIRIICEILRVLFFVRRRSIIGE